MFSRGRHAAPRQKSKELRRFGRAIPLALAFVLTMGAVAAFAADLKADLIVGSGFQESVNVGVKDAGPYTHLARLSVNGGGTVNYPFTVTSSGATDAITGATDVSITAAAGTDSTVSYTVPCLASGGQFSGQVTFTAPTTSGLAVRTVTVTVSGTANPCGPTNTPPTLNLPADMTVEGNTLGGANVTYTATASDAQDLSVSPTCSPASGSFFALGGPHIVSCSVTDSGGLTTNGSFTITVVDTTGPAFTNVPDDISKTATGNSQATATWTDPTATDIVDGARPVTCVPASGSTFNIGVTTVTCSASDLSDNANSASFTVTVNYAWNGFFRPVDNLPTLNVAKAGSAVPIKFSLAGNQGLSIMAAGSPTSKQSTCEAAGYPDVIEETVTAGHSSLGYDATADQYTYVWKTDKSWAGACRTLTVKLADGSVHQALFKLTK